MPKLTLVSHKLCPYVQRAAIALAEKGVPFKRVTVDLANKPDWFQALSPLGKVPVLIVHLDDGTRHVVFESAVILEYLEEILPHPLHPADPLERARARGWMEYGSAIIAQIGRFYSAPDEASLAVAAEMLGRTFDRVEAELGDGPWFAGDRFGLVDAVFGPVLRYFDVIDRIGDFGILDGKPRLAAWRARLAERPSVRGAVAPDYPALLSDFIAERGAALSRRQHRAA